jgi:cation diffusion facilitator CzcD-associated flavoprotein CzcO
MNTDYQIGIIGTGFAGLVAALRLKKSGRNSFVIFERAAEIGGTWRDNIYPGCAVDIPSPLYSFADEPNLYWSRLFSTQQEILNYMKEVIEKNDIRKHIRFKSNIIKAEFDELGGFWKVNNDNNEVVTVKVLLAGLGPLNRISKPEIPGQHLFKGKTFHSAEWDSGYDLTNKKVAVIGTGASAIQIVPGIAQTITELTVFQRTAAWIMPRYDKVFPEKKKKKNKRSSTFLKWQRVFHFWLNEFFGLGFIGNKTVHRFMTWGALKKLKQEVHNPEIRKKLTPNYAIGCKRILKSDDYYQVFNKPNVHLVTEAIEAFTKNGIQTVDGQEHIFDAVVYATGFHSADLNVPIHIIGKGGASLIDELIESGGEVYKGTIVPGFPNFGIILGPNTGLGHNSVIHIMESQMNYIMHYIRHIENLEKNSYLDIRKDICEKYNIKIQQQFAGTVWASGCKSWYHNEQGKNTTLFPRLNMKFRNITRRFDLSDYIIT